jgi:integrase
MRRTVARKTGRAERAESYSELSLYAPDGRRKYLNHNERRRALAAIALRPPEEALFGQVLAWSGARVSEVLALTPASFQLECGIVSLVTLKRRRLSVRELPLPSELIEALEAHLKLSTRQADADLANERLWPWSRVTAWRLIKDVMREAAVVGKPACPRGFRHGFGVAALQANVPLNLLQRWLGHARMSTTAIYANVSGPEERSFARRFRQTAAQGAADVPEITGHSYPDDHSCMSGTPDAAAARWRPSSA